jgi:hypothetical protein
LRSAIESPFMVCTGGIAGSFAVPVLGPFHGPLYEKWSKTLSVRAEFGMDIQVRKTVVGTPELDFGTLKVRFRGWRSGRPVF